MFESANAQTDARMAAGSFQYSKLTSEPSPVKILALKICKQDI